MKRLFYLSLCVTSAALIFSAPAEARSGLTPFAEAEAVEAENITLKVNGMTCVNCSGAVEKALKDVDGVQAVSVNLAEGEAVVTPGPDGVDRETLVTAVTEAGYEVPDQE